MNGTETPRVYVACLAAYNAGKLHGEWVDATDEDELQEGIARVLKTSPIPNAEEHAFHDFENFGSMSLGEYTNVDTLTQLGALIEEHGAKLVAGLVAHYGAHYGLDAVETALENCLGVYESKGEFMEEMWTDLEIPEPVRMYIDWEAKARDEEINGAFFTVEVGDNFHFFPNM